MQAATLSNYGTPDAFTLAEVPTPTVSEGQILVRVRATVVTQGDRRLRSADFPGISAIPGRLLMGVTRPRNTVHGTMFAGRVEAVGEGVTDFAAGEDVFGACDNGAYAEYLAVKADSGIAKMPSGISYEQAAALPYGAVTALMFLEGMADVQPGQKVAIVGAAGGVGRYAVQVARHLGAEVTAVCSARDAELVREFGAHHVVDYRSEDFTAADTKYDVIFDTPRHDGLRESPQSAHPDRRVSLARALGRDHLADDLVEDHRRTASRLRCLVRRSRRARAAAAARRSGRHQAGHRPDLPPGADLRRPRSTRESARWCRRGRHPRLTG